MKDVAPELLESIKTDFEKEYEAGPKRKKLFKALEEGTATYKEANEYAIEVGEILAKAFQKNLSSEVLPDGHMYYNIAQRVIAEPLSNNHKLVSTACAEIQTLLNKSAGLGLKGIVPDLNKDRIQGILNLLSGKNQFDDIKYMLDEPVVNFTQSVVNDAIKTNAEFQYQSGLSPKIRRTSTGKCCKWCDKLVGTYDYASVRDTGNDVFRRHKHCRCTVEFITNGKRQNVHTKKWKNDKLHVNGTSEKGYMNGTINRSGSNKVDMQYIASEEYRRKFTQITDNSEVNQKIRQTAKAILTHRNGTDFEDTYIIDLSTGKTLIKEVNSKEPLTVTIKSDDVKRAMRDAKGKIMGIHNHPTNMPPTGADFVVAGSRGYDFGLVITHSGEIYWYKTGEQVFLPQSIDLRVEKNIKARYNKDIVKAHECALDDAKEVYGIQWGKLK